MKDKVILITGGTGSFGQATALALLRGECRELRIFSRDEFKQHEMALASRDPRVSFHLGDVRDSHSLAKVMAGVDFVLHAAALKHVPSCEASPREAILTNVLGTQNVVDAALQSRVSQVVILSTDKAVFPVSAMGATKALAEKIAQAAARSQNAGTIFSVVRYGNVLYSRGSVVPLFVQQIRADQPLTITDPEMTRFLLPLATAVELVIYALENAVSGDLFVHKARACSVGDLAEALLRIFNSNSPKQIIGPRHGEKQFETLASRVEMMRSHDLGDFFQIPSASEEPGEGRGPSKFLDSKGAQDYTSQSADRLSIQEIEEMLLNVPEIQRHLREQPTPKYV